MPHTRTVKHAVLVSFFGDSVRDKQTHDGAGSIKKAVRLCMANIKAPLRPNHIGLIWLVCLFSIRSNGMKAIGRNAAAILLMV